MIRPIPSSIFVPNHIWELIGARFNHCSTVSEYKDGIAIAWYGGTKECHDDQSVFAIYIDKNGASQPLILEPKTGNPVLWTENGRLYLLWSRFEDNVQIKRIVDRWKYCSLWLSELKLENDQLHLVGNLATIGQHNLLGRCKPIGHNGKLYLPLYDEVRRNGVIITGNHLNYKFSGRLGVNMIQPTLWSDGDKICSLSRNFYSLLRFSQYSESIDGVVWSDPVTTNVNNHNSSLHAINWCGYNLLLWNNTQEIRRSHLTLGIIEKSGNVKVLGIISKYGAYPSLCGHIDGDLYLSYTNAQGTINVCKYDRDRLISACRGGDITGD